MLYWIPELAPPIQEFQLLGEHDLPTSSLYRAHCRWLSRASEEPQRLNSTVSRSTHPLTHSCYWMPLKRAWFYLFHNFLSDNWTRGYDSPNLLFSRLNSPSSFTISMYETCFSPSVTFVALHWICSRTSLSSLYSDLVTAPPEPSTPDVSPVLTTEAESLPLTCW